MSAFSFRKPQGFVHSVRRHRDPARELPDQHIEQRHEKDRQERGREHATHNTRADGLPAPPNPPGRREGRLAAPAPVAITSGNMPKMKAIDVRMIGRKRSLAASMAASISGIPASYRVLANSTIRMAFFADSPMSVTMPI